jgi:hypothetical protein
MLDRSITDSDSVLIVSEFESLGRAVKRGEPSEEVQARLSKLEDTVVQYLNKKGAVDVIKEKVVRNKTRVLIIGTLVTAAIATPYILVTKTNWIAPDSLYCSSFMTKDPTYSGKEVEVCLNGVTNEFNPLNGDAELDIFYVDSMGEKTQVDVTFWIADTLGDKHVDYTGEYNINRIRKYNRRGILIGDQKKSVSSWEEPLVPKDVREKLWKFVKERRDNLNIKRLPFDEKLSEMANNGLGTLLATLASIGATAYKFFKTD